VRPPVTTVYSRYREDSKLGLIEWAAYAPIPFSPSDRMNDMGDTSLQAPSRQHWMGTEYTGADVFSRMIHACRIALAIGLISTGIGRIIGVLIGGLMGYFVGKVDILGMRLIEIFEAIPTLFLLITFVAFYGRNLYAMMVIIGITGWTSTARFIRAEFLRLRTQDFVQAAIASGLPLRSVLFRHMLPNGVTPVLVTTSFGIAAAILYESTLSFLGLGLIDEPSWGQILNQARGVGASFVWWIAVFPGMAIFLTVLAYNLIGEALRDALDPKLRKAE
jgi:peptide/nickel transport system permease protein